MKLHQRSLILTGDNTVTQHKAITGMIIVMGIVIKCNVIRRAFNREVL